LDSTEIKESKIHKIKKICVYLKTVVGLHLIKTGQKLKQYHCRPAVAQRVPGSLGSQIS